MNAKQQKIEALFDAALKFKADQRSAFLASACGDDSDLLRQLEVLLQAEAEAGDFLPEQPVDGKTVIVPITEKPGDRIGRYKLLQQIGEGGCGVVYMAEQEEPVRRRVALKVIKLGMDTRSVIARFEAERQALAMMDHPNIAKVLDAGSTDSGRPYFVMELVRGVPITEYCDKNHLPTQQRLDLFVQVCHAIQHAHQKGVIHRDIKPSNILVTLNDGVPLPMVIDFGIAKATSQKLTEKTLFTNYAQMIGTPAYMSPEQAEMSKLDVDTRTDIYSLGVLLYELLTGTTPFPAKELLRLGYGEMQRVIAQQEPLRPSTRLSTMDNADRTMVAKNRQIEASALGKVFRGDLDWIVMKCLEKDRARRYETANGLAADLKRHLNNEPVTARPPSMAYKFQKAWRRNKVAYSAGVAIAAALVVGIGISVWQARVAIRAQRAEQQRRIEAQQEREAANSAKAEAEKSRQKARAEAYAADMNLAQKSLAENNLGHARQLLARHRPAAGQTDLRGWEWRYLWERCRGDSPIKIFTQTNGFASVELSRDGRWLAVMASFGKSIHILDLADPHAPRLAADLSAGPMNLLHSFSPVEPVLAYAEMGSPTAINSCRLHFWNFLSCTNVASLPLPGLCIGLRFSTDGRKLITLTGKEGEARSELTLWDTRIGTAISRHSASADFRDDPSAFAATPDLSLAAYCGSSNNLYVMDVASGTNVWTTQPGSGLNFWATAISPDGKVLVASASGQNQRQDTVLRRWDLPTGQEIGEPLNISAPTVLFLRFLDDGKTLATCGLEHAIRLWDLSDPQAIRAKGRPWLGSESAVISVVGAPDAKTLISGSADGSVHRWDVSAERRDPGESTVSKARQWWWGPDGRSVFVVERTNQVVQRHAPHYEVKTDVLELPNTAKDSPYFSSDCRLLVTTTTNGVLHLWDLQERKLVRAFGTHASGAYVEAFLPQRKKLVVRDLASQQLEEWDLKTFEMTRLLSTGLGQNVCVSPDEAWLLTSEYYGRFTLMNLATHEVVSRQLPISQVISVRFSGDGRRFAASSFLGTPGSGRRPRYANSASLAVAECRRRCLISARTAPGW